MSGAKALIYAHNFHHNINIVQTMACKSKLCVAVKSNAYGHGMVELAQLALSAGAYALGLACVEEAQELRAHGIKRNLILYGVAAPRDHSLIVELNLEVFISSLQEAELYALAARQAGKQLSVHVKIDTGMGRVGCSSADALEIIEYVHKSYNLIMQGLCTHFPSAEDDKDFTLQQVNELKRLAALATHKRINCGLLHAANSAALCLYPETHLDMVRPGLAVYGYAPLPNLQNSLNLRPVMELRSELRLVKRLSKSASVSYGRRWFAPEDCWIGIVPLGYADGLPRTCSGKIKFLIQNKLYDQIGTICMDQCMINLGKSHPPSIGSQVTVFGPRIDETQQNLENPYNANDLSIASNTIPYEILCGIGSRVPRILS
jgi:alanine racemase